MRAGAFRCGVGSAVMVPPCSSQTQLAMARPRPVPPAESLAGAEPVEDPLERGRPGCRGPRRAPRATTCRRRRARAVTRTSPCGGLCRTALSTRLATSWASRAGSATHGEVGRVRLVAHPHAAGRRRGPRPRPRRSRSATRTSVSASGAAPASMRERSSRSPTSALSRSALGERGAQGVVVGLHDAVDEVLEQGALGGERGAQLVRHGRDELAALLVGGGEVGGHRVERPRQRADLVGRGRRDALRVVARRHPARGGRSSRAAARSSRAPATGSRRGRPRR